VAVGRGLGVGGLGVLVLVGNGVAVLVAVGSGVFVGVGEGVQVGVGVEVLVEVDVGRGVQVGGTSGDTTATGVPVAGLNGLNGTCGLRKIAR